MCTSIFVEVNPSRQKMRACREKNEKKRHSDTDAVPISHANYRHERQIKSSEWRKLLTIIIQRGFG